MFTVEERDHLQELLLARAEADDTITGAAFAGSHATGDSDRWSDTDLILSVRGELATTLHRWTRACSFFAVWACRCHRAGGLVSCLRRVPGRCRLPDLIWALCRGPGRGYG